MFQQRCKNDTLHVCDFIRKHGGFTNWYILRLASKPCTTSLEARTELRKHFDASHPLLNRQLPTRTQEQYAQSEEPKAKQKIYRGENRDKIQIGEKAIYQRNKEELSIKRRVYYLASKERVQERMRTYRERLKQQTQ